MTTPRELGRRVAKLEAVISPPVEAPPRLLQLVTVDGPTPEQQAKAEQACRDGWSIGWICLVGKD
jgi:hypothetical protein